MSEEMSKYEKCGAYHWLETSRSIRNYNAFLDARYRWALKAMDYSGLLVLDLGCGDGVMTYRLKRAGADVVGLDADPLALKLARSELAKRDVAVHMVLSLAERIPFRSEMFDAVLCAEMIEHVADPHPILSETARVLKSDGTLILTTPYRGTRPQSLKHEHEYTSSELEELLSRYFEVVRVWVSHPLWLKRLYERSWIRWQLARWVVNASALVIGYNPFYTPRPGGTAKGSYSQLLAMAKAPRR